MSRLGDWISGETESQPWERMVIRMYVTGKVMVGGVLTGLLLIVGAIMWALL